MFKSLVETYVFKNKLILAILVILALASAIESGHKDILTGCQDFQWDNARILLDKTDPYKIWASNGIPETAKFKVFEEPHYFPSCYVLLWPYAVIPWPLAEYLWLASNFLFTFFFLSNVFKMFIPKQSFQVYLSIFCLFLIGTPWRNVVYTGQHILFGLCFFSFALRYRDAKPNLSGLFLAIAFFKYAVTFPLSLFFIYKKQYRPLLVALAIHLCLHLFISFWINVNPVTLFFEPLKLDQDIFDNGYLDFLAVSVHSGLNIPMLVPYILSGIVFLVTAIILLFKINADDLLVLSTLSFVSLVVVYHEITDYVVLIFPLILLLLKSSLMEKRVKVLIFLSVLIPWCIEHQRFRVYVQTKISNELFGIIFNTYDWIAAGIFYLTTISCLVLVAQRIKIFRIEKKGLN